MSTMKHIPDEDRQSIIRVIHGVFWAEHIAQEKHHIAERLKAREITPDEYVELIADVFVSVIPNETEDKT